MFRAVRVWNADVIELIAKVNVMNESSSVEVRFSPSMVNSLTRCGLRSNMIYSSGPEGLELLTTSH